LVNSVSRQPFSSAPSTRRMKPPRRLRSLLGCGESTAQAPEALPAADSVDEGSAQTKHSRKPGLPMPLLHKPGGRKTGEDAKWESCKSLSAWSRCFESKRPRLPTLLQKTDVGDVAESWSKLHRSGWSSSELTSPQIGEETWPSNRGASTSVRLQCFWAEGHDPERLATMGHSSLDVPDGTTCVGRQHQPDMFHALLGSGRGNCIFISRTHFQLITHPGSSLVLLRNVSSNPVFADQELLCEGDWCLLKHGAVLSFGRPQDGHIVFFLKMAVCINKELCRETRAWSSDGPDLEGVSLRTSRQGTWSVCGDGSSSSWSCAQHAAGSSDSSSSLSWVQATTTAIPLQGRSLAWQLWQEGHSVSLGNAPATQKESRTAEVFRMLRAARASTAAIPGDAGGTQERLPSNLDLDEDQLERLRQMGGRSRDRMAKRTCSGKDQRVAVAEQDHIDQCSFRGHERLAHGEDNVLGLEWSLSSFCGKLQLAYAIALENTKDMATAISRATAGLVEMDLHRHFRSEVSSVQSLCFGVVANDCIWREQRHDKNMGFKDDAIWTCSVTDALDEPKSCVCIDFSTADADLEELRGVAFPPPEPGSSRPSVGLSMTFQICPPKDRNSAQYRIACQTLLDLPSEAYDFLLGLSEAALTAVIKGQVSELAGRLRNFLETSPLIESRLEQGPRSELYREIREHLQTRW